MYVYVYWHKYGSHDWMPYLTPITSQNILGIFVTLTLVSLLSNFQDEEKELPPSTERGLVEGEVVLCQKSRH